MSSIKTTYWPSLPFAKTHLWGPIEAGSSSLGELQCDVWAGQQSRFQLWDTLKTFHLVQDPRSRLFQEDPEWARGVSQW